MTLTRGDDAIVIVDNDSFAREFLSNHLSQEGFEVFEANDGASLAAILHRSTIALMVLGLQSPDEDGLSVCRQLRAEDIRTPIIILSAKAQEADRIAGLMAGADDYVCKPFNPREVRARIQAILRRSSPSEEPGGPSIRDEAIRFGPFELNMGARALRKDGQHLNITTTQFAIFKVLARHAGRPISREKLAQVACGREHAAFERGLDVQVSRLRKLLEDGPFSYIQTIWGVGYMFEPSGRGEPVHRPQQAT